MYLHASCIYVHVHCVRLMVVILHTTSSIFDGKQMHVCTNTAINFPMYRIYKQLDQISRLQFLQSHFNRWIANHAQRWK